MKNNLGLYVHIPFCEKKCHYCDFASFCRSGDDGTRYLEALERELLSFEAILTDVDVETIYIGGGTPSSLSLTETEQLLTILKPYAHKVMEWTIEANPESVSRDKVAMWRDAGINRVSLGVQSLDSDWLKRLGRIHSSNRVTEAVGLIRERFDNLNLDLIYGLSSDDETYLDSLHGLISFAPEHISIYELEVYDHLPLARMLEKSVDSDISYDQFHRLRRVLEQSGFARYEVSNFARPGYESRHNQRYWLRQDTLGVGLAAHSLMGETRFANPVDFQAYLQPDFHRTSETLTPRDALTEEFMLGLRLVNGIDYVSLKQRYVTERDLIEAFVKRQMGLERLVLEGDQLKPTTLGLDLLDRIVLDFMSL